jgi:hypothetical protein
VLLLASITVSGSLFAVMPAYAVLGGGPMQTPAGATASAAAPAAVARAAATISSPRQTNSSSLATPYSVIETTLASGTIVREYVSQGTVFGLAWRGPRIPNLSELLGSYFPQFTSGVKAARAGGLRGRVAVEQSGLVVHSGGHMGLFMGQAYLPQALPPSVSSSDIQ